jgi:nucleotide-binding universal stress UspA family protein
MFGKAPIAIDLIVLGSQGSGFISEHNIARHAKCSVLISRCPDRKRLHE